uniref:Uncharacterized protein n=1 Tax=Amphimedon queenslandica TaxID=400682 RepID=A0A1X7SHY4_AMPQE
PIAWERLQIIFSDF